MKLANVLVTAAACFSTLPAQAGLINGSFDEVGIAPIPVVLSTTVPGWKTTASDQKIEIWDGALMGVPAYEGQQFAELNGTEVATLFQDVSGIAAGTSMRWQFAHRGRTGVDVMRFLLTDLGADGVAGGGDDTVLLSKLVTDGHTAWGFYSGTGVQTLGNKIRFSFESVSANGGQGAVGNFLDAANFAADTSAVPEPASWALVGLALAALLVRSRRR